MHDKYIQVIVNTPIVSITSCYGSMHGINGPIISASDGCPLPNRFVAITEMVSFSKEAHGDDKTSNL